MNRTPGNIATEHASSAPANRSADAVLRLAKVYRTKGLSAAAQKEAEEAFRRLIAGADSGRREILSRCLCRATSLPRDIAISLARDQDPVALPVLEFSPVVKDPELVEIVRAANPDPMRAIARRTPVSARLVDELAETGHSNVLAVLLKNATANISERALLRTLDRFPASQSIQASMIGRSRLPAAVVLRLADLVPEPLRSRLLACHAVRAGMERELVMRSPERPAWWQQHLSAAFR